MSRIYALRKRDIVCLSALLIAFAVRPVIAQQASARQEPLDVVSIVGIRLSDAPPPIIVHSEADTDAEQSAFAFYSLSNYLKTLRLQASLDAPVPAGSHLVAEIESTLGESRGRVELTSGPQDLVVNIQEGEEVDRLLIYTFWVDSGTPGIRREERTIILSLYDPEMGVWAEARQTVVFSARGPSTAALESARGLK